MSDGWKSNTGPCRVAIGTLADVRTWDGEERRMVWDVRPYNQWQAALAWWPVRDGGEPTRWGDGVEYLTVSVPVSSPGVDPFDPKPWTLDQLEAGFRVTMD